MIYPVPSTMYSSHFSPHIFSINGALVPYPSYTATELDEHSSLLGISKYLKLTLNWDVTVLKTTHWHEILLGIGPEGRLAGPKLSPGLMNPPQTKLPWGLTGKTGQFGVGGGSVVGARVVGGVVVVGRVAGTVVATVVGLVVGGGVVGSGVVVATVVGLVVGGGVVGQTIV